RIQEPAVVPCAPSGGSFSDVEGDAVAGASQLVGERGLLEIRKPAGRFDALDGQSLGVLPCLESVVDWHATKMANGSEGCGTILAQVVPVYSRCLLTAVRLCA